MKTLNFFIIELGIFCLGISLFYAANLFALVEFAIAVYFSRRVHKFHLSSSNTNELKRYHFQWKIFIVLIACMMIVKYFFMIWLPSIWNAKYPFDRMTFGCDE
jgi:hypothetical protein